MKDLISSLFSHEIKNSLSSIRFGVTILDKYEMSPEERKVFIQDLLNNIDETISILEEYINFIKFQFIQKLKYENISLYKLLEEIKNEVMPLAHEKGVNIYIKKSDVIIYSNKFWLKRAIYNIVFNAIKYNKKSGSVNIQIEKSIRGVYLSIRDTGIGIDRKKLKTIFKFFEQIDEESKGFGIGLALSKSVIESFGGKIAVKSNENIGSDFVLFIPTKPKDVTIKRIAVGLVPASVIFFLVISYFPIYTQNYQVVKSGGFISYKLEDGSVLKFDANSKYELNLNKNLYNTKFIIDAKLIKGSVTLKAIQEKATIAVADKKFNNLGTDFEIAKQEDVKVAVFSGKVKGDNTIVNKKEGLLLSKHGAKKVILLDALKGLKVVDNVLTFVNNPKAVKYKIIISKTEDFSDIYKSFYTLKNRVKLNMDDDSIYYVKVFAYDKNLFPSMPATTKFVNLTHYTKALKLEKQYQYSEAMFELQRSIATIKNYSSLPYYEIARLYYKQHKYKKSIFYIKKAMEIEKRLKYTKLLVDNYIALEQYNDIEKEISEILKSYPNDVKLLYYKALILKNKGKYKEAQKILFKLLQIDPSYKKGNLLMSEVMYKLNKKDLAKYYKEMGK